MRESLKTKRYSMKLEGKYYTVLNVASEDGNTATYHIALRPDCDIYQGHFPGNPVCPGVCNIQTIKECAERSTGRQLRITFVKQCRLTTLATPAVCKELDVKVNVLPKDETTCTIVATISDADNIYMEYKGEMTDYKGEATL